MPETADILVVGGGPAGAAAAALLAQAGFDVIICEQKVFPRHKVCGEFLAAQSRPVLARLDLLETLDRLSPRPISRVLAISPDGAELHAPMPATPAGDLPRTFRRDLMDDLLLRRAAELGARVRQPCTVRRLRVLDGGVEVLTTDGSIAARIAVLAHGLAQRGDMTGPLAPAADGYLCFKTHLAGAEVPDDTIVLTAARGVYAGLVRTSPGDLATLAMVVTRDRVARHGAAAAQYDALLREVPTFARMLRNATPGLWLSSGPLRPGVRTIYAPRRFFVGNAAGEVHALVGEGMTLALRGAAILADTIREVGLADPDLAGMLYEKRWRKEFATRYHAANLFAHIAMRPALASVAASLLARQPDLFRVCVASSGKW